MAKKGERKKTFKVVRSQNEVLSCKTEFHPGFFLVLLSLPFSTSFSGESLNSTPTSSFKLLVAGSLISDKGGRRESWDVFAHCLLKLNSFLSSSFSSLDGLLTPPNLINHFAISRPQNPSIEAFKLHTVFLPRVLRL